MSPWCFVYGWVGSAHAAVILAHRHQLAVHLAQTAASVGKAPCYCRSHFFINPHSASHTPPGFLEGVKSKREKLFGFGHRVYKNFDPRAKIIRGVSYTLLNALVALDILTCCKCLS